MRYEIKDWEKPSKRFSRQWWDKAAIDLTILLVIVAVGIIIAETIMRV